MTKRFPFPNVVVMYFRCRGTPTLLDDPNALCWKVWCSWVLLDIMQASRFSLFARGCGLLFAGCWRRILLERSKMGIPISNFIWRLYCGCFGQLGTTMIPVATSKTILSKPFQLQQREQMHRRVYTTIILKKH